MTITKTLIANSSSRAVVKVTGTADTDTTTISLADLAFVNEYNQTKTPGKVNITKVWYSVSSSGAVTVDRNSVTVLKLFGHDTIDCFGLAEQNDQSAVVTFSGSAGGTIIIEFSKVG